MRASFAVALLIIGCVSGCSSTGAPSGVIPPEIHVRVLAVPESRPARATGFTSAVEVDVLNKSAEPLTVSRIQISSMGSGRYSIAPVTESFNRSIAPGGFDTFRVWVQVAVEETLTGSEEPVFIRGIAEFRASTGAFRRNFVQRVNPTTLQRPRPGE